MGNKLMVLFVGLIAAVSISTAALATETQVNTYTSSHQYQPSTAMDSDGNFVIAWTSVYQDGDSDSAGIYAQRYDSAGVPQGTEFKVNTYATNTQDEPSIAMDSDGDFVIAWLCYIPIYDTFSKKNRVTLPSFS